MPSGSPSVAVRNRWENKARVESGSKAVLTVKECPAPPSFETGHSRPPDGGGGGRERERSKKGERKRERTINGKAKEERIKKDKWEKSAAPHE